MKITRAILSGALTWLLIVTAFGVLDAVPALKYSLDQQTLIVTVLILPFAALGAFVYYGKGSTTHGVVVGLTMAATALLLDALITVPVIEIPKGGSYQSFYSYPLLWLLVLVVIATVWFYWNLKVKRGKTKPSAGKQLS